MEYNRACVADLVWDGSERKWGSRVIELQKVVVSCAVWALTLGASWGTVYLGEAARTPEYPYPSQPDYIACRSGYVVGFDAASRIPVWTAYRLTGAKLADPKAARSNDFRPDPQIPESAQLEDYRGSGYSRGHMVPAADMKGSVQEMSETFLLTNIVPQDSRNNSGAWNRIEQKVRALATAESSLYVYTGAFCSPDAEVRTVGANRVRVPDFLFKVVLDETPPRKAIAFLSPNRDVRDRPRQLAVTVDAVEALTGLDFFRGLPDEDALEAQLDLSAWGL